MHDATFIGLAAEHETGDDSHATREYEHCVFLDELGINLKPARALGMATIKVGGPAAAITELEVILGHAVR